MSFATNSGRLPILSIFFRIYPFSNWFFTLDFHPFDLQLVTVNSMLVYLAMIWVVVATSRIVQKHAVSHADL